MAIITVEIPYDYIWKTIENMAARGNRRAWKWLRGHNQRWEREGYKLADRDYKPLK